MSTFIRLLARVLTGIGWLCNDGMQRGEVVGKLWVGLAFLAPGVLVFFFFDRLSRCTSIIVFSTLGSSVLFQLYQ